MLDLDSLFKYIVTGGGAIIAYFFKSIHNGIKAHEGKVEDLQVNLSKLENRLELVDNKTSVQVEKLEDLSKMQFDQLHMEISDLKKSINTINVNIQELVKSKIV
jgi:peptidoglycan hydrolase CwlO-like protein